MKRCLGVVALLSVMACSADDAGAPSGGGPGAGGGAGAGAGGSGDKTGAGSPSRPLVEGTLGGPVVDYGPPNDDLSGTACPAGAGRPEIVEQLSLSTPRQGEFALWIPENLCTVRCTLLRAYIGDEQIKDHVMPADEVGMRQLAERHACAVLTASFKPPYYNAQSRKSGPATEAALAALAKSTGHPELATAPLGILTWGGDASQFGASLARLYPKRTAAVATWLTDASPPADVPGLSMAGGLATGGKPPAQLDAVWKIQRESGAPIAFALDPLVDNGWGNTKKLGLRYLDRVLPLRLEPGAAASKGALRPVQQEAGWLGHLSSRAIEPAATKPPKGDTVWLPDEGFAQIWAGFQLDGSTHPNDADFPKYAPLPGPLPEPIVPQGKGTVDAPFGTSTQGDASQTLSLPMPPLTPQLLVVTYAGGAGDQYLREVGFEKDGSIFAEGTGFRVVYDPSSLQGAIEGDPSVDEKEAPRLYPELAGPPGNELVDPRNGQTYHVGYRQTGATEQTPFLNSSAGWKMWDHDDPIGDQRGIDVWLMPSGLIGFRGDSKAAHDGVLGLDPFDRSKPMPGGVLDGAWSASASTSGSIALLIDPSVPRLISGTWLRAFTQFQAVDPWGRLYMPLSTDDRFDPDNLFRMPLGAKNNAGLFVLDPSLRRSLLNTSLGGTCNDGAQNLRKIALRGNLLVAGGTTCAANLPTTANAVQSAHGGGQDGWMVVLRLWE